MPGDCDQRCSWRAFRFLALASPCLSGSVRTLVLDRGFHPQLVSDAKDWFTTKFTESAKGSKKVNSWDCRDAFGLIGLTGLRLESLLK